MLTINLPNFSNTITFQSKTKKHNQIQSNTPTVPAKCLRHIPYREPLSDNITEIPNSYYPPTFTFKGSLPNELIKVDNINARIEKIDILHDDKNLDKLLSEFMKDMDKCLLAKGYDEYNTMVQLVNNKWQGLTNKIEMLNASPDANISQRAAQIFNDKFVPALLHFQEIFAKMDNSEVIQKGFHKANGKNGF